MKALFFLGGFHKFSYLSCAPALGNDCPSVMKAKVHWLVVSRHHYFAFPLISKYHRRPAIATPLLAQSVPRAGKFIFGRPPRSQYPRSLA